MVFTILIGKNDFVKQVALQEKKLDVALFICFEHDQALYSNLQLSAIPPFLHVLVSASIDLVRSHMFGALNIHMDSKFGLKVLVNDNHPSYGDIERVEGRTYDTQHLTGYVKSVKVEHLDNLFPQKKTVKQQKSQFKLFDEKPLQTAQEPETKRQKTSQEAPWYSWFYNYDPHQPNWWDDDYDGAQSPWYIP